MGIENGIGKSALSSFLMNKAKTDKGMFQKVNALSSLPKDLDKYYSGELVPSQKQNEEPTQDQERD